METLEISRDRLVQHGPATPTWRVHTDPAMWVAGVRALMLQALHPVAIHGIWQNSRFREDPLGRLWRTANFIGVQTCGAPDEAAAAGRRLRAIHRRIRFTDPSTGRLHRVDEADLLLWVHCAEVGSFLEVVARAGLPLTPAETDRYVAEQRQVAAYVGLSLEGVPGSVAELRGYLAAVQPSLRATREGRAPCAYLLWPEVGGRLRPLKPLWSPIGALAYASLPRWARDAYGLLPEVPGQETATTAALRTFRAAGRCVPHAVRDRPNLKRAKRRLREAGTAVGTVT